MSEPRVTRIHIEYEDGSFDDIENLPQDTTPFYDLRRKRPDARKRNLGLHTNGAIAGLLFITAFSGQRREYSCLDADLVKLLKAYTQ